MSTPLDSLVARLQQAVPARNGAPADYTELVRSAVWQLSTDVPVIRTYTINVVSGTATYALPEDFMSVIELATPFVSGNTLVGDGKLVAVPLSGWEERYYIDGLTIVFDPEPAYTMARTMRYAAGHVIDAQGTYPRLSANGARIAMLYGQFLALQAQAVVVSGDGWKYRIGDEEVDKSRQGTGIQEQAKAMLANYQNAIRPLQGYGQQFRHSMTFDGLVSV